MSVPLSVWLVESPTERWPEHLAECLTGQGAVVERVRDEHAARWAAEAVMPTVRAMPQLLVLSRIRAAADDWSLLRLLDRAVPWRFVPRAVVSEVEDPASLNVAYGLGVSSFVVIAPERGEDNFDSADSFARYWTRTARVPSGEYFQT